MVRPAQLGHVAQALEAKLGSFVELPKVAAPFTTVVRRAQVVDFSKDLMPRMGIERIQTQYIQEVQGEVGPAGERVFKPINDFHDQIRFVGDWSISTSSSGQIISGSAAADFAEITFYGTGLNLLHRAGTGQDYRATVDGGAEGANFTVTASTILDARNYSPNCVTSVVSGLTLGLHTVKIRGVSTNARWSGFEILNEATTLKTAPGSSYLGGTKLSLAALDSQAYNSGFETVLGSAGTKGGHVVVYQKADGSIGKAIRYTEASTLTNTSTDHTNEEFIRRYKFREFGAGRADDYSTLVPGIGSARAFTLDDGTTTLSSVGVVSDLTTMDNLDHGTSSTFTFVGTGLDFFGTTGSDTRFVIDGGAEVTLPSSVSFKTLKIASGLAYGTHTVHLTRPGSGLRIVSYDVYGPKKPTIPAGAVELADYYLMADAAFSTSGSSSYPAGTGSLVKNPSREFVYTGTWAALSIESGTYSGFQTNSTTNGSTASLEFVGTGIILTGSYGTSASVTIQIDGANYTGAATVGTGSLSGTWTPGTATWALTGGAGSRLYITGLTYGRHKVQVTVLSQVGGYFHRGWEIITPIHSQKSNVPGALQNTLTVGSNAISDNRSFADTQDLDLPNWAQAVGVSLDPSTTSTALVPIANMSVVIKTSGNPIEINYHMDVANSVASAITLLAVIVDGVQVGKSHYVDVNTAADVVLLADSIIAPVSAGVHTVQLYWRVTSGTASGINDQRNLSVKELA